MAEEPKTSGKNSNLLLVAILVIAAFVVGMMWTRIQELEKKAVGTASPSGNQAAQNSPSPAPAVLSADDAAKIADSPFVEGNAKAKVTLVEFSDFQCPYCKGAYTVVKQIQDAYGDKVKLVFRQYPLSFHPIAMPAALASWCAQDQGKFWPYHDKIFENQETLSQDNLKKWAQGLGMNMTTFNTCLDSQKYKDKVEADVNLGTAIGVQGTPTFFINGTQVNWNSQTEGWFNALKRNIDTALAQ